ncbi:hypothetical protein Emag_002158 [Eimeria magna]
MAMASLKLICLAGVSLTCLEGAHGAESSFSKFSGTFTGSNILPLIDKESEPSGQEVKAAQESQFLNYACNSLQPENSAPFTKEATFAVHSQTGSDADCSTAAEYWKGAIANFNSLPPEYQKNASSYTSSRNVSFVALFNPKANAAVDCAYVTCQKTANQTGSDASGGGAGGTPGPLEPGVGQDESLDSAAPPAPGTPPAVGETDGNGGHGDSVTVQMPDSPEGRRLAARLEGTGETVTKEAHLLVCVTTPAALNEGERPFTADFEGWSKSKPLTA